MRELTCAAIRTDSVTVNMRKSLSSINEKVTDWLLQGISPRRLALTIALGFAFGCIPVVGVPTTMCVVVALTARLNLPVLQTANYAAMPFQVMLMLPFFRMGGWLFASSPNQRIKAETLLHLSPMHLLTQLGSFAGHAMVAWLVIAVPAVTLMTFTLTMLLRRVPALAAAEACD